MHNCGEPKILEVFKSTLPSSLHWALFPIENFRQAVEIVKRILTKEKLDKQSAGQSTEGLKFLTMKEENEQRHKTVVF